MIYLYRRLNRILKSQIGISGHHHSGLSTPCDVIPESPDPESITGRKLHAISRVILCKSMNLFICIAITPNFLNNSMT